MDRLGRKNNYWLGKKFPKETIEKIRLSRIGKRHSEESKQKMSLARLGRKLTEEHKRKISLSNKGKHTSWGKGHIPWNKGLKGLHHSPATEFKKGCVSLMKGKHHSEETILKIKQKLIGKFTKEKNPFYGKTHSDKTRKRLSETHLGEKSSLWKGGISLIEYSKDWTNKLRKEIRLKYNNKCQICGCPEKECYKNLSVHHIDYNKHNNNPDNLIALCHDCHSKTNYKREYWIEYFRSKTYV